MSCPSNKKNLKNTLFDKISKSLLKHYGPREILSILAYGNRIKNQKLVDKHSDYDITIVFKKYPNKNLPSLPPQANITTLFWPDIKLCGVKNFRLYNHGEFYIVILSEAIPLYGTNPFKKLKRLLPQYNILNSLKEQIFLHCSKLSTIALKNDRPLKKHRNIIKYSFRIAQNFYFLKNKGINYERFAHKSYADWALTFKENDIFPKNILKYLRDIVKKNKKIKNKEVFDYIHSIKLEVFKLYE